MTPRMDLAERLPGLPDITVFPDHELEHRFYLVPEAPRFRTDPVTGQPVFKFIKYRFPIDRPDGKKGGGYCAFDVEFSVPDAQVEQAKELLQERLNRAHPGSTSVPQVEIGSLTYLRGEARLSVAGADGTFVENQFNPVGPSLYGNNVTTYGLELTPDGASFFAQAMQGQGSSTVSVEYGLDFLAQLPPIEAFLSFYASTYYDYFQEIDEEWSPWGEDTYRETIRETLIQSESITQEFHWGGLTDESVRTQIRNSLMNTFMNAIERRMADALDTSPGEFERPDGIEDVRREITRTQISSFSITYNEDMPYEAHIRPQGGLPALTSLKDGEGRPLKWEDFSQEVDLDDPFFKTLEVRMRVNADFEKLPIHSVEILVDYEPGNVQPGEFVFDNPDDTEAFRAFVEDDTWEYKYSYQVNYKGESRAFKSDPITTDEGFLTINVGDTGILSVPILPGDLNWQQVSSVQIRMEYDTPDGTLERQFIMDQNNREHLFQDVVFEAVTRPYRYQVKYFMQDGREFTGTVQESRANPLYINDPFTNMKDILVQATGDLQSDISTIMVELNYADDQNDYHQSTSFVLNSNQPSFTWTFPVIRQTGGRVTYAYVTNYRDGRVHEEPEQEATKTTILVGEVPVAFLEVDLVPMLIDWSLVRLVKVELHYVDAANGLDVRKDFLFREGDTDVKWTVALKDASKTGYEWKATYFMADGTRTEVGWTPSTDLTLILEVMPA